MPARIAVVIPAAGSSSRMGGSDKLLEQVGGIPLLRRTALEAIHSDATAVLTTIGGYQRDRRRALIGLKCRKVRVDRPELGMANSLLSGIARIPRGSEGVMILLPDMPEIRCSHINQVIARFQPDRIVRGTDDNGNPGHPVIIPAMLFPFLVMLSGDQGLRDVIRERGMECLHVELPGMVSRLDLDTRADWVAWRRG